MKGFSMRSAYLLIILCWIGQVFAQQEYFTEDNKKIGLEYYKKKIYQGCIDLKDTQDPVDPKIMQELTHKSFEIVQTNFAKAFEENPKVRDSYKKDMKALAADSSCQRMGNDCRARMIGLSIYYYQQLRADIPDCEGYEKSHPATDAYNSRCELELKYRQVNLQGVRDNYGMLGPGNYKKELIAHKNNTTIELFNLIMRKDKLDLHICNSVEKGIAHRYALNLDKEGDYFKDLDPEYNPEDKLLKDCIDKKITLHSEFMMSNFDEGRSTTGSDQVEPVKSKIMSFIKAHPEMIVTDVSVTSSSSKTPYYTSVNNKKVIDPKSDEKNLSIATDRAIFVKKSLNALKTSSSQLSRINFESRAELSGPDFQPIDLNDRFVTRMTPGYTQKIEAMYRKHQKIFEENALRSSPYELLDESQFVNLYQAKFKPFHGFKILIMGHKKEEMKCAVTPTSEPRTKGSSKQ